MKQNYVLEWSQKQNMFHVQPLSSSLARSQECFLADRTHQYIIIMVGDAMACHKMADTHRHLLIEREKNA